MNNEQHRYTAQEMREVADAMSNGCDSELVVADADECGLHINREKTSGVASMLRQAADSEEENAQLKSRLEAVVKHLEKYKGTKEPDYCCADCIEDVAKEVGFSFASGERGAE